MRAEGHRSERERERGIRVMSCIETDTSTPILNHNKQGGDGAETLERSRLTPYTSYIQPNT